MRKHSEEVPLLRANQRKFREEVYAQGGYDEGRGMANAEFYRPPGCRFSCVKLSVFLDSEFPEGY